MKGEGEEKYLKDPANFDQLELNQYYNEFNETDESDAGKAMLEGIEVLYENPQQVDSEHVIVFGVF